MVKRIVSILCLVAVPVFLSQLLYAAEEKKTAPMEWKVKGEVIYHPNSNDVKVMTESYDTITMIVDYKTSIQASVKAKPEDMAKETGLRKGEVTFTVIDGKPVAKKITYTAGQKWEVSKPKAKKKK